MTAALTALVAVAFVATATPGEPRRILITNVNVFDGVHEQLIEDATVLVEGNPLEDITVLSDPDENLASIMKDGEIDKNTLRTEGLS